MLRQIVRSGPRPSFASTVPRSGEPFPPLDPCGTVLQLRRYYGSLRLLAVRLASLRCPSFRDTTHALVGLGAKVSERAHLRRGCHPVRGPGLVRGDDKVSQVPGESSRCAPCSQTPVGSTRQAVQARRMLPSAFSTASAPTTDPVEAQSHGSHRRCLRFAARVTPATTQDSLPAGGQPGRAGFDPQDSIRRFRLVASFSSRLRLAQTK